MKIAVISETSAGDRNPDIVAALEGRDHEILNIGMKKGGEEPQLGYTETGFLTGLFLHTGRADFIVGGCGTGQGYLNSAMQYPGVFCGLILDSLDAWLFTQINGGNAISLALNKGYGWAGDVNLHFIFDRIFSVERGAGYPEHRKKPQAELRKLLETVGTATHKTWPEVIRAIPAGITRKALAYPGVAEALDIEGLSDDALKTALREAMK